MRVSLLLLLVACGGAAPPVATANRNPPVAAHTRDKFSEALAELTAHEVAADWTPEACARVAKRFEEVGTAIALYDAGLALERCDDHAGAVAALDQAVALDPKLESARVDRVLVRYKLDRNPSAAIDGMERVVIDSAYRDVRPVVELAALQMERRAEGDTAAALENLKRALAVDEKSMMALNQLALFYLATGHLQMAALVTSQAIERDAAYAPIFNTAGIVQHKLAKPSLASKMFQRAIELDPHLFEAQANLGRLNLSYRGFDRAENAFRAAIRLRPRDYDAHLGLALALRGQITEVTAPRVQAVRNELAICMKIDPSRPEAYFNDGVLAEEFDVKLDSARGLARTREMFDAFERRAAGKPELADAMQRAEERKQDAIGMGDFLTK